MDRRVERDWTVDELIGELWAELSWERQVPQILLLAISAAMHDRRTGIFVSEDTCERCHCLSGNLRVLKYQSAGRTFSNRVFSFDVFFRSDRSSLHHDALVPLHFFFFSNQLNTTMSSVKTVTQDYYYCMYHCNSNQLLKAYVTVDIQKGFV